MEKNSKIGLTAGAFMACSGAASGATVTQIRTLTGTPTFSSTFSFLGADTLLPPGTRLTDVQFQVTETLDAQFTIQNTSGHSAVFSSSGTDMASVTLPVPVGKVTSTDVGMGGSTTLSPGAQATLSVLGTNTQSSPVFTSGLSGFLHAFDAAATDAGSASVSGADGAAFEILRQSYSGNVYASLYYSYAPIPEPTTMTLIGLGLSGLAARRRAKKGKDSPVR
jgi:PEP-CTERM motif-containing protein